MKVFDLKEKLEFLNEVMELEFYEWTNKVIIEKIRRYKKRLISIINILMINIFVN